ncbi:beta-klotho [Latimeria chalumnae]|uniref:beta-klotho n=1 Tax=Latimeria chalumnae TaxID=7897 RepID=UPI0003C16440|nr:PREDICTED: beta-klotho [Latimeria chalumnae]|eukprot:XP_006011275.1 PREDICTED: beta-klotho [Latimeria chalumnae]
MYDPGLRRLLTLIIMIFVGSVNGDLGEGRAVWKKLSSFNPVNETQLFLYDTFPKDFLWGVGTAAFQVEGAWDKDGKSPSIWDHFVHSQFYRFANVTADASSNSYRFLDKDLSAMELLGVKFYRFSISWTRLFSEGTPNKKGLRYYNTLIDSLIKKKIQPVVTLYHWDLPLTLQQKYGGWKSELLIDLFHDYSTLCFETFGDRVKYWITIHNPYLVAWHGYSTGMHAPGERGNPTAVYTVAHNLIKAHAKVWHTYDKHFRHRQRGYLSIVLGSHWIQPENGKVNVVNIEKCQQSMDSVLGWFAKPIFGDGDYPEILKNKSYPHLPSFNEDEKNYIKGTADFFALSFGPDNFRSLGTTVNVEQKMSLHLRQALNWIKLEYNNPRILIAENGWFTDSHVETEDTMAMYLMKKNINEALRAIKHDGVNLFGYTAWSLLDGFEWQDAYNIRRGLFYVDFDSKDKTRSPKSSALFYKQIIQQNGFLKTNANHISVGQFSCDFAWGVADSVIQAESFPSSPQFVDSNLYVWNITGDGHLHKVNGVRLKTRPRQCTDFGSIKKHLALVKKMKVTHFRFALNWSLILPNGDLSFINKEVLRYYRCLTSEMLRINIKPMVTLYYPVRHHFGLPSPLINSGGWLNSSTAHAFRDYADLCFQKLGDLVKLWVTLNEPNRLSHAYRNSSNDTYRAAHNLLIAHALTWQTYDKKYRAHQGGQVSVALHADWAKPANPYSENDITATVRFLQFEVAWFADPIFKTGDYPASMREYIASKNKQGFTRSNLPYFTEEEKRMIKGTADFFALNHFTTRLVMHRRNSGSKNELDRDVHLLSDITWLSSSSGLAVVPWGIRKILNWVKTHYGNTDIYITANGVDDKSSKNDELRKYYIKSYTSEVLKAHQTDHVNIKGYFGWKLSDKVMPHFGFFNSPYYDSNAKSSVEAYSKLISDNGFPLETSSKLCEDPPKKTYCSFCVFILEKRPLIFFGFCLLLTLLLVITIIFLCKTKSKVFETLNRKIVTCLHLHNKH